MGILRNRKIEGNFDVDEILLDSSRIRAELFRWEHRLEFALSKKSMVAACVVAGFIIISFLSRSFYLSIVNGGQFQAIAKQNHTKEIYKTAPRGIIYSAEGTALVGNTSTFNLVFIPAELAWDLKAQQELIGDLVGFSGMEREEIINMIGKLDRHSFRPVPFLPNITRDKIIDAENLLSRHKGVRVEENLRRRYPLGDHASHVTGYTGLVSAQDITEQSSYLLTDIIGKSGLEYEYEDELKGKRGVISIETSAVGREERIIGQSDPVAGSNLTLFLSSELQKKVTDVTRSKLQELGLSRAAVVAVDPRSGGILAMQSFPLFDANVFLDSISPEEYQDLFESPDNPLFNRALSGLYPPGSTIKPYIGAAALEEQVVNAQTTVHVTGSITVAGQVFHDNAAHGTVNLKRAIALSSNVYFYTVGGGHGQIAGLGPYKINEYLRKFGFGQRSNIDLPSERDGLVPSPEWKRNTRKERWYVGDTYNISIGQGDMLVSPLQLASAVSSIANGGTLLQPRMVKIIGQGENARTTESVILNAEIASEESINQIREAMREMVLISAAGQILHDLPVSSAGKTGTAQFGVDGRTHAWFSVFAPYEKPEIALVVLVEGTKEGSLVAVPIAHEILKWYFTNN